MKTHIRVGLGLILVLAVLSGCSEKQDDVITFGFIGPLTGDSAIWGQVQKDVNQIAVDEINAQGGIAGKQVRVIYEDGKCDPKVAVTAFQKIVQADRVNVLLNSGCSGPMLALAPIAEQEEVLLLSSYATNPLLSDAGEFVFRNAYSDRDTGIASAELMFDEGHRKIAILFENTDYAAGLKDVIVEIFEEKGGDVILVESFEQESRDFRSQITKVIASNPDAIYLSPQSTTTGGNLIKQLREVEYNGPTYGNYAYNSEDVVRIAGDAADGVIGIVDPEPAESTKRDHVFSKYKEKEGQNPSFPYPAAAQYDLLYIMKQAVETVGEDTQDIITYLYTMDEFEGALGIYSFDKNGDIQGVQPALKVIEDGKIIDYRPS